MTNSPIIFIGMHRSGTSMLGQLLESIGLFSGTKKDENNEAIFFKELNDWLMVQCGASWDIPGSMHYLWENEELLTWVEDYLRYLLDSPRAIKFLGFRSYFSNGGITRLEVPWGWKNPRNTFTFPIWQRIFTEAKVVYIERHGVDVAQSLLVRSQKGLTRTTKKYQKYRTIASFLPKQGGFIESPRCATLQGGFSLWQEYMLQAEKIMKQLPNHRLLKLRYEDLLEDPFTHLRMSAEFCGLDVSSQKLNIITKGINSSRAYSYLNDPELRDFAQEHLAELSAYGYK